MSTLTTDRAKAIADAARAEIARRLLLPFAERIYPGWRNAPHLERIAHLLEMVERGELRRLMVNLPPRHGKSLLCSQVFPAWYLGRNSRRQVIMATHGVELSERNSRAARLFVQDERWPFEAKLSTDSTSAARWNLVAGGGLFACGVDSSVTGRGANLLLLDDVQHDSGTDAERESVWRWFCEIAVPRLEPGAAIVAIGTRFAEDDIFGRLLTGPDADEWHLLRLPAVAEQEDPLGRAAGSALWGTRVPLEELQARRRSMGSRWFECQFQQNPVPLEGNLIKAEWLARYTSSELPAHFEALVMAVDCAAKTGVANDYSAIAVLGASKDGYYLLDVVRRKVEYTELRRMLETAYQEHQPQTLYIEDASSGTVLLQELKRDTRLPVVGVRALGSKVSRVESVAGLFEGGRVRLPAEAPWLLDFERELLGFPNAKHDDTVDAVVLALTQLRERTRQKPFALRVPPGGW